MIQKHHRTAGRVESTSAINIGGRQHKIEKKIEAHRLPDREEKIGTLVQIRDPYYFEEQGPSVHSI